MEPKSLDIFEVPVDIQNILGFQDWFGFKAIRISVYSNY